MNPMQGPCFCPISELQQHTLEAHCRESCIVREHGEIVFGCYYCRTAGDLLRRERKRNCERERER